MKNNHSCLEPDFTPETYEKIVKSTEKDASVEENYQTGATFKNKYTLSLFSEKTFWSCEMNILNRITNIQNQAINNLIDFANETSKTYIQELANNSKSKKSELDNLLNEKKLQMNLWKNQRTKFNSWKNLSNAY